MMNLKAKAFTLVEVLSAIAIILLCASVLWFVIGPVVKEKGSTTICAQNMAQLIHAGHLYSADYDEAPLYFGVTSPQVVRYLKAPLKQLMCPKALVYEGTRRSTYIDELNWKIAYEQSIPLPSRRLPNGKYAPLFDQDSDAILKCKQHGIGSYKPQPMIGANYDAANQAGKVQTAYFDGRVRYAPLVPCWETRYLTKGPNAIRVALDGFCDGTLEDKE